MPKTEPPVGDDGFVPDYAEIARHAKLPTDALAGETVTIPTQLFRFLLGLEVRRVRFDADAYRAANPDIDAAFQQGLLRSVSEHYVGTGYFEGRSPGWRYVDEAWYASHYVDLAIAKRSGRVGNLQAHFCHTGRAEGRAGSAQQLKLKEAWDKALGAK